MGCVNMTDSKAGCIPFPFRDEKRWQTITARLRKTENDGLSHAGDLLSLLNDLSLIMSPSTKTAPRLDGLRVALSQLPPNHREAFLSRTVRVMCQHVREHSPSLLQCIHTLDGQRHRAQLSAYRCFLLVAMGFLCLYHEDNGTHWSGHHSSTINFRRLFPLKAPSAVAKMKCFILYLSSMATAVEENSHHLNRVITFERLSLTPSPGASFWSSSTAPLLPVAVMGCADRIECSPGLQADFANRVLGGGVLASGSVQEEIRFAISPELLVARLLIPPLNDTDAAVIRGTRKFTNYQGYKDSFRCAGPATSTDDSSLVCDVVAFDAIDFSTPDRHVDQYSLAAILRETNKVYAALSHGGGDGHTQALATGNWGCGVFGGDPQLKALIQWMASSQAGVLMHYYPMDDRRVAQLADVVRALDGWTVGQLWQWLMHKTQTRGRRQQAIFDTILRPNATPVGEVKVSAAPSAPSGPNKNNRNKTTTTTTTKNNNNNNDNRMHHHQHGPRNNQRPARATVQRYRPSPDHPHAPPKPAWGTSGHGQEKEDIDMEDFPSLSDARKARGSKPHHAKL
ncbi:unnamed protein product [Vitrella brassicaformis CCMP3155]|uniref:poly(ADP-ribose) glycohydrolase n=2 Tax=Vitrella brassicaformis TaxID=1169539 RepID=A0A0G4FEX2_VITBC|nr:unnamed protein product [Vitrella brassicaformis CCMP3155]|eukprot:CEM11737.1 unnamed protein product [Vitrella brassicaformis CCMP3155]